MLLLNRRPKRRILSLCPLLDKSQLHYSQLQCLTITATVNLFQISGRLLLCTIVYLKDQALAIVFQPIQTHLHCMPMKLALNDFLSVLLGLRQRSSVMAGGLVHPMTDMQTLPDGVSLQIIVITIRHHPNLTIVVVAIITPRPHRYQRLRFLEVPERCVGLMLMSTSLLRLTRDNHLYRHPRFRHPRNWVENDLGRAIGKLTIPTPVAEKIRLTIHEMIDVHPLLLDHWIPGDLTKKQPLNGEMYLVGQEEIVIGQRTAHLPEWKTTCQMIIQPRALKEAHTYQIHCGMKIYTRLKNLDRMQIHPRKHY